MRVWLYRVGRNLNRAYRTCEAFGVTDLCLLECDAVLSGALFASKGRVRVVRKTDWPCPERALALETGYALPLSSVLWGSVDDLIIGGETSGLPVSKVHASQRATIPMVGQVSGLTVEAALAIALYSRMEARL